MKFRIQRCGLNKPVSLFIVILLFVLIIQNSIRSEELSGNAYVESLIQTALQRKLHDDRYWHTLLHYKKGIFGIRSLIDDPRFFIAEDGKYNPESELKETIRSFFTKKNDNNKSNPVCRFIARYYWLKEKLNFNESELAYSSCEDFDSIAKRTNPKTATLIFPTSLMNRPAAMFGHTLLTIDTNKESRLLSYAVNYSAFTDASSGVIYTIKGLFGLYDGYFSVLPYYEKIKEYSDLDQRDIWEYDLNLTHEEIIRMMRHIYELANIYSNYYFFDENCSYNLFFLLEAARPSLDLTDLSKIFITPLDTVIDIDKADLIAGTRYRPSKAAVINFILSELSTQNQDLAISIVNREIEPDILLKKDINLKEKIKICDFAIEAVQHRKSREEITAEEFGKIYVAILKTRSSLGREDNALDYNLPVPSNPLKGTKSRRITLCAGFKDKSLFQEIEYRPTYHDLMDPDNGYLPGQHLQCNIAVRYYDEEKKFKLQNMDLWNMQSICPRGKFYKPYSWKITAGLMQKEMRDDNDHLILRFNQGIGLTYANNFLGMYYALIEGDIDAGKSYDNNCAIGAGGSAGIINNITGFWKIQIYARDIYFGLGDTHNEFQTVLLQNFRITQNNSIRFEIIYSDIFNKSHNEYKLSWNYYL